MTVRQIVLQKKPEAIEAFAVASLEVAWHTILDSGHGRFEILTDAMVIGRCIVIEAQQALLASLHFIQWREITDSLMFWPPTLRQLRPEQAHFPHRNRNLWASISRMSAILMVS